jgi:hypothetical protein
MHLGGAASACFNAMEGHCMEPTTTTTPKTTKTKIRTTLAVREDI